MASSTFPSSTFPNFFVSKPRAPRSSNRPAQRRSSGGSGKPWLKILLIALGALLGIGLLTGLFRLIRIFGILRFLKIGLSLGAIIAGVVLFILGKRDPSASKVKRLIIPIVCVVLGVILFIIPFGGFASAGGYSTPDNIIAGTSDSYSTTVYFSPEEDDYYVNFYPSYDGVLYVYTKDTDGCYYYPEISVLNERLSGVEYSYNGSFYSVPIEAGKTYYVCTRFYDYSYAESNYYSYGSE